MLFNETTAVAISRLCEGAQFRLEGSEDIYQWIRFDPEEEKFLVQNQNTHVKMLLDQTTAVYRTQ